MGAATIATSFLAAWEDRRYGRRIDPVSIDSYPVFVLGFWRSGTTLLHNLLAQDTERFIYPAGYQVFHPHTFLTLRSIFTIRNRRQRRGIDDFPTGPLDPQEDEIAMLLLTLESPYLQLVFPSNPGLTPPPDIYRLPPND